MSIPKVMVVVPADPVLPRIYPVVWQSLEALKWPAPFDMLVLRDDRSAHPVAEGRPKNIERKFNRARDIFLAGDWDEMLIVESDNVIPPGALLKMTQVDADIVYGLYCARPGKHGWMIRQVEIPPEKRLTQKYMRSVWGQVVPSNGLGTGCTLIHRRVLAALSFRSERYCPDWYLALDAQEHGFRQMTDCRVIVGHTDGEHIIWPDPHTTFRLEEMDMHGIPIQPRAKPEK